MIAYSEVSIVLHSVYACFALLIMTIAIYIVVNVIVLNMSIENRIFSIFLTLVCVFVLLGISDSKFRGEELSIFAKIIGSIPAVFIAIILVFLAVTEIILYIHLRHRRKNMLTANAVKETLDALPDGVCFSEKNGMLLLVNRKMDILCEEMFDKGIMNSRQLLDDIKTKQLKNNAELIRTEPNITVKTSDGEVWDFRQREITADGSEVIELIAYNVTEQYNLNLELKENNSRMDAICKRLGEFSENVTQLTHEKEILNAIISVHNNLGKALLMLRSYLVKPYNQRDRNKLLFLWRSNMAVLNTEISPEDPERNWKLLLQSAANMGVEVIQRGKLSDKKEINDILMTALQVCLTNTISHAKGNKLYVRFYKSSVVFRAEFTNNGIPPIYKVKEGGGLQNLRSIVENEEGIMTIESFPKFKLILKFPSKGEK